MTKSAFAGMNLKRMVDDSLARYEAQNQEKIRAMQEYQAQQIALREQQEKALAEAEQQAQQAGVSEDPYADNAMLNANSDFMKYLAKKGITLDAYKQMPEIQRQRELVDPYLEDRWVQKNMPQYTAQGVYGKDLDRAKEGYLNEGRSLAMANFSGRQDQVSFMEKVGSWANAGARGVLGLVDAGSGLAKTALGKDNIVSDIADTIVDGGGNLLRAVNSAEQQELADYARKLMSENKITELGKLVSDYPTVFPDQLAEQIAPMLAFSKGANTAAKTAPMQKLANSKLGKATPNAIKDNLAVGLYSGYQMGGGMAQELAKAGIDPNSAEGIMKVATTGVLGMGISTMMGGTLDKAIMKNFTNAGVSQTTARRLTDETIKKLKDTSAWKTYVAGVGKNLGKGALGEGSEEGLQSLVEEYVRQAGKGVGVDYVPNAQQWQAIKDRMVTGVALGAAMGAPIKGGLNAVNRYGDAETAQQVKAYDQEQARIAQLDADVKAGKYQDDKGSDRTDMTPEQLAEAKENNRINTAYENHAESARGDRSNIVKAQQVEQSIADLAQAIADGAKATGVQNVPTDVNAIITDLNNTLDGQAKVQKLQAWAKALADNDLDAKATELAKSFIDGYEFAPNGKYANTRSRPVDTMTTAVERSLGRPVSDLTADLVQVAAGSDKMSKLATAYQQAMSDGYLSTADKIAKDFDTLVTEQLKAQPSNTQASAKTVSDTVKNSMRANNANLNIITRASTGKALVTNTKVRDAYKADPSAFIDQLLDDVSYLQTNDQDPQALSSTDVQTLTTELGKLKQAWDNDTDYKLNLDPKLVAKLAQVK